MARPRVLIEQWLPIDQLGAESRRENTTGQHPPLNRLHVWWARRPLAVSRAAVLASILPAYPMDNDDTIQAWPEDLIGRFPTFDRYKKWFLELIGIFGDPAASQRLIQWAKTRSVRLTSQMIAGLPTEWTRGLPSDLSRNLPFGYPRAFTYNPNGAQVDDLCALLEWTWGKREVTFCDPMAGGGSLPFEALRYGMTVVANELNPVASVILRATLDYPARFGPSLVDYLRRYGRIWCRKLRDHLEPFYPLADSDESVFAYLWSRTVACPTTGKPVPLSPNWWLSKGSSPVAVAVIADQNSDRCRFEIVRGRAACARAKPDQGTIKRGTGISPWTGEAIDGDYIKAEAQAGRMGQQLYAVAVKKPGGCEFRLATDMDVRGHDRAIEELDAITPRLEEGGLIPHEPRRAGRADWCCEIYGMTEWCDTFTPRQLLATTAMVDAARQVCVEALPHPIHDGTRKRA